MEDKFSAEENVAKVLTWINKDDDPEQALKEFRNQVTSDGRYENHAQRFLDGSEFKDWSKSFYRLDGPNKSKRVIWISGP